LHEVLGSRLIISRQFAFEVAILATLCIASIFFFPAVSGSYSTVHGPVTALRSIKTKARTLFTLALAALYGFGSMAMPLWTAFGRQRREVLLPPTSPPESISILRC
jgi:hypothetical protein